MDIRAWLRDLGLERYEPAFREHEIDVEILPTLTSEDLEEIGVAPLGHRKRILSAIAAVRTAEEHRGGPQVVEGGVAQRRQLTIMFADVVGSTELSRRLDPEDLREIDRAYQDAAKAAIERYGGHVAKYMSDGVLADFGSPRAHEDDAERAIRAGHDLVATMRGIDAGVARAKGASLHVRVGVETGPVVVGDIIGEGASQENAVVGETPNLAARLLGVAGPDEPVVGPRAQALVGGSIRFTPLGAQTLKGFGDPVEVWRLDGLGLGGGRFERSTGAGLSGFVGRAAELEDLAEAFARVRACHFEIAELSDPAARYASMAGEKALDLFALRDAGFWFGKALQLLPDETDEAQDRMRARAVINRIQVFCWDCQYARMVDVAESHLAPVEALGEVPEVPRVLSWIGEGYMHVGRFADAEEALRRALAIGEKLGDSESVGYALGEFLWLRTITAGAEPVSEVEGQCIRLMQIAHEIDDNYLATLAHYTRWADFTHRGRIDEARRWAEECIALGRRTGYPHALCWSLCMLAQAAFRDGHHVDAETHARAARAGAQCAFDRQIAEMSLGFALIGQGRFDEGIPLLSRAQRLGDDVGAPYFAYAGEALRGRALAAAGNREHGLAWLGASRAHFLAIDHRRAAALSSLAIGEIETEAALAASGGGRSRPRQGPADRTARAGIEALDEAIELAKATAMDGVRVQSHLLLAKLARAGGRAADARRHLDRADRLVRPLGWTALAHEVDQAIAEARGR